ncbi:alpha/beta hydrolase fold domain-containing protein [Vibrio nigripulchritudo]|uniref:alpha/beta hydrolase n=1 Tax=Vibrio nigripulchritudo TaxID=28173 RepID=UPI0003B2377B|nr:alpha/beta hydrolase fold domain-containing protein [Vibrio nigripulchritudo]CCN73608.1 exported hypothetical protein [Vibrio nigripulchritudo SFn118]
MAFSKQSILLLAALSPLLTACDDDFTLPIDDTKKDGIHVYPSPSGEHAVGIKSFDVIDYRRDTVSPVPGESRKLHIKVYYPTDSESRNYQGYFDKWGNQVAYLESQRPADAPIHPLQHELSSMLSWSISNAEVADNEGAGWPILFYSHGFGLFEADNTELLEELTSQGFVVVAINHTYLSGITTFKNGKTANVYLPPGKDNVSEPEGRAYFDQVVAPQISQDVLTVYQWLLWNQWRLDYEVDVSKVGMLGYSLGGSAAMNACQRLSVCQAASNMDGMLLGNVANHPLNKPLLLLESGDQFAQLGNAYNANQAESHLLTIANSQHNDFTDQNRWIVGYPSAVEPDTMHRSVKESMVSFFLNQLEGRELVFPDIGGVTVVSKP